MCMVCNLSMTEQGERMERGHFYFLLLRNLLRKVLLKDSKKHGKLTFLPLCACWFFYPFEHTAFHVGKAAQEEEGPSSSLRIRVSKVTKGARIPSRI